MSTCSVAHSCPTLCDLLDWTVACQAPLFMGFSRHEYWSGLPSPSPGDLLDPGIEPLSPVSLALADRFFFITVPPGKPREVRGCQNEKPPEMLSLIVNCQLIHSVRMTLSR